MPTRWNDNDAFGHVNNVVYYSFVDTAVNNHLIANGIHDARFVAASSCRYLHPCRYPQPLEVGLRVSKLGRTSVTYQIGIFSLPIGSGEDRSGAAPPATLCAEAEFTHVYVDADGRPTPLPEQARVVLQPLVL